MKNVDPKKYERRKNERKKERKKERKYRKMIKIPLIIKERNRGIRERGDNNVDKRGRGNNT